MTLFTIKLLRAAVALHRRALLAVLRKSINTSRAAEFVAQQAHQAARDARIAATNARLETITVEHDVQAELDALPKFQ